MAKILIVDDDPLIRTLLKQILEEFEEKHGVEILTAENGLEAIETVKEHSPELMFLDVMMPKMNGFEVCQVVKNDLQIKNLYVIMLSAKGQETDKQKANKAGADYYITKPFNISELVGKVSEVLGIPVPYGKVT